MVQTIKTEALVVHSMRWSDTSKIVHLFTAEHGYVKVIARGALRPKSAFRGVLENLNRVEVVLQLKESRGLQVVTQAALVSPYSNIREDLNATAVAFAMLELIKAFIHYNEAAETLFRFTADLLDSLNDSEAGNAFDHLLRFLLYLSDYLGFGWEFSVCRVCGKRPAEFPLKADIANGAVVCPRCPAQLPHKVFRLNEKQWFLLEKLQDISPRNLGDELRPFAAATDDQMLLDMLLAHLNYHTEQTIQLRSLKMYLP